jgi:hypothetical protein
LIPQAAVLVDRAREDEQDAHDPLRPALKAVLQECRRQVSAARATGDVAASEALRRSQLSIEEALIPLPQSAPRPPLGESHVRRNVHEAPVEHPAVDLAPGSREWVRDCVARCAVVRHVEFAPVLVASRAPSRTIGNLLAEMIFRAQSPEIVNVIGDGFDPGRPNVRQIVKWAVEAVNERRSVGAKSAGPAHIEERTSQ